MVIKVFGYAATSPTEPVGPFHFNRRDLRDNDVLIEILYCGVCHSDIHQARNEWGGSLYPMVPGHEIIGQVREIGPKVTKFKVGDRVGVGCMVDSCQVCDACQEGLEQYCENKATFTYNDIDRHDQMPTYGGYSEVIVVTENFVLKIPDSLDLKSAAPLLCAGITTYSPLRHWKIGQGHHVGVIGLGGLGHMAIKFAKALGAEVTLFTRTPNKEEEAKRLGTDHVLLSTDCEQMQAALNQFDFIIDTVPVNHNLNDYLPTLKRDGVLILVGALENLEPGVHGGTLISRRKSVAGSMIGGIEETQEMLDFCGKHGISCDVEMIAMEQINTAYDRMLKSDVKYRFVIDMASLKESKPAAAS